MIIQDSNILHLIHDCVVRDRISIHNCLVRVRICDMRTVTNAVVYYVLLWHFAAIAVTFYGWRNIQGIGVQFYFDEKINAAVYYALLCHFAAIGVEFYRWRKMNRYSCSASIWWKNKCCFSAPSVSLNEDEYLFLVSKHICIFKRSIFI